VVDLNWSEILANSQNSPVPNPVTPDPGYTVLKPAVNWDALGPTFLNADAKKNEHELTPTGILDTLWMMIHLKLFVPLSMLTTASFSQIHFNNNLKFKKIPFSNAAGKYALDQAHFPSEESLTDAEYLQAHKHLLSLMKICSEHDFYGGWKAL